MWCNALHLEYVKYVTFWSSIDFIFIVISMDRIST